MIPSFLRDRYAKLSERYRTRGWDPPELPGKIEEAANVIYEMAGRINNRVPLRVVVDPVPSRQKEQ